MFEPYLNVIKDPVVRSHVTRFRISSHKLEIETGRYRKLAVDDRLCRCCSLHETENEEHFLLRCPLYESERILYISNISNNVNTFKNLGKSEQFQYVMSSENDETIIITGNFVYQCMLKRLKFLDKQLI